MDDLWTQRWKEGRIGFHEGTPNEFLVRFAPRLDDYGRVLVPLCGKSVDLVYLAERGHQVVGVELVEDAVQAFFAEQALTPTITARGPLTEYTTPSITIYQGDVFDLDRKLLGPIDAVYDRAALIALPADIRQRYVDHLIVLSAPFVHALTITLEHDAGGGPPYSVTTADVARLYEGYSLVHLAEALDTSRATPMLERCFLISG